MKSRCCAAFIAISALGMLTSGPNATVSPASLTYSTQLVGTTSAPQSVTLTDNGTAVLHIASIGFKGANPDAMPAKSKNTWWSLCRLSTTEFRSFGLPGERARLSLT